MTTRIIIFMVIILTSCNQTTKNSDKYLLSESDTKKLQEMILKRESAMINKNIDVITRQFDSTATFINGGGFYYDGIAEITNFHNSMFTNDSLTYTYKAGKTLINPISENVAIVYYPWEQNWTLKNIQADTLKEVGLMTIIAIKKNNDWKWKSITNQRTKEFFEDLTKHKSVGVK